MLSRWLFGCQSLTINIMIRVSQIVRNSQLCHLSHYIIKSLPMSLSLSACWSWHNFSSFWSIDRQAGCVYMTVLQCSEDAEIKLSVNEWVNESLGHLLSFSGHWTAKKTDSWKNDHFLKRVSWAPRWRGKMSTFWSCVCLFLRHIVSVFKLWKLISSEYPIRAERWRREARRLETSKCYTPKYIWAWQS